MAKEANKGEAIDRSGDVMFSKEKEPGSATAPGKERVVRPMNRTLRAAGQVLRLLEDLERHEQIAVVNFVTVQLKLNELPAPVQG